MEFRGLSIYVFQNQLTQESEVREMIDDDAIINQIHNFSDKKLEDVANTISNVRTTCVGVGIMEKGFEVNRPIELVRKWITDERLRRKQK